MMAICEKCIKKSVCKLCDGSKIMGCIEFVSLNKVIMNGQPLPDDCEILTREAYADLCMRASEGQEPNCSEIPTGSTANPFFTVSGVNELAEYSIETIGHSDPYLQGMCNGIEYMRATLTDTEPHFFTEIESEDKE